MHAMIAIPSMIRGEIPAGRAPKTVQPKPPCLAEVDLQLFEHTRQVWRKPGLLVQIHMDV